MVVIVLQQHTLRSDSCFPSCFLIHVFMVPLVTTIVDVMLLGYSCHFMLMMFYYEFLEENYVVDIVDEV